MAESKVVEAVAVAAKSFKNGSTRLTKQIEDAMSQAVLDCMSEGITEPEDIKAKMMEARQKVLDRKFATESAQDEAEKTEKDTD